MKFVHVAVEGFQGIERAELAFGPNLNVLYGPNDLGKSTLARAIRAALLVVPGTAEARQFIPWHKDEAARVRLIFQDDDDRYWRIKKTYGEGAKTSAELGTSTDGTDFSLDSKNREVEDQIGKCLRWGVAPPGGKGGPRIRESFLSKVLLAPQTDVDGILGQSLDSDGDESGKLRLSEALAALAQHPKFKIILAAAQEEVDQYFAPGGRRRGGKESPFTRASAEVKRWMAELGELKRQEIESKATQDLVLRLIAERGAAKVRQSDAADALAALRARLVRGRVKAEAVRRLEQARAAVSSLEARVKEMRGAEAQLKELDEARARATLAAEQAAQARERAEEALRGAEDAHRRATSKAGARERELRRAQIERELADLKSSEHELTAAKLGLERVVAAKKELHAARTSLEGLDVDAAAARTADQAAGEAAKAAEQELTLTRGMAAYGKWRIAAIAAEGAARAAAEAGALRSKADDRETEAAALEGGIASTLPGADALKALRQLWREHERAAGALGGGVAITLRPKRALAVTTQVDGVRVDRGTIDGPLTLDAERAASLVLSDLVEIEVQAGAPDKRRAASGLRARWAAEGAPVLARAGVDDVDELEQKVTDAATAKARVEQLRAEARSLREQAAQRDARALELAAKAEQLASREEALGGRDRAALAKALAALGESWETSIETREAAHQKAFEAAAKKKTATEHALSTATYRWDDAKAHVERLAVALAELQKASIEGDADAALRDAASSLSRVGDERRKLEEARGAMESEGGRQAAAALKAVESAKAAVEEAKAGGTKAASLRDAARSAYDGASGQVETLRGQLAMVDRSGAEALVVECEAVLAALPAEPPATEADVEAAERRLESAAEALAQTTKELHNAEGGLEKVGGAVLDDNLRRVQEALDASRERERSLELDASSWQLLRDVLREAENEEGNQLGRALSGPVTARMRALTASRYGSVLIGPTLQALGIEGISGAPAASVLEALSVGTKDQLATLLRMTVAQELHAPIILDDHLVHTDPERLAWFRRALRETAALTQVIVLTCRPGDYLAPDEIPGEAEPARDLAGGALRAVDLARVVRGWRSR